MENKLSDRLRLIQASQDPDEGVCWNAAEALGKIGTPEALEAVKKYQSR